MTRIDWNEVRRRILAKGFTEEEAVRAVAIMADETKQSLATRAGMPVTNACMKAALREFEHRLTIRFGVLCFLWLVSVAVIVRWLL